MFDQLTVYLPVISMINSVVASIFICSLIFLVFKAGRIADDSLVERQRVHVIPTARHGGIAIILPTLFYLLMNVNELVYGPIIFLVPVFVLGLVEDFYIRTPPMLRLGITLICCAAFVNLGELFLDGFSIPMVGAVPLNVFWSFAVSVLGMATLINAINLVDGTNGLAGAQILLASLGLAMLSFLVGEKDIFVFACIFAAATFGFLIFNFPLGKIFLGDAGAYFSGAVLSWIMFELLASENVIPVWSLLSLVTWSLAEVFVTVCRRLKASSSPIRPDRLHLHHLLMRVVNGLFKRAIGVKVSPLIANSSVVLLALPFHVLCIAVSISFLGDDTSALIAFASLFSLYCFSYAATVWTIRRRFFLKHSTGK